MLFRFVSKKQQLRGEMLLLSDAHVAVHFRADSLCYKHYVFFYLFSPFCLSKSNYVCIRLSTSLLCAKQWSIFPPFSLCIHYVILTVTLRSKATVILQLGAVCVICRRKSGQVGREMRRDWTDFN